VDGDATWVSRKYRKIEGGSTGARRHRCVPRREAEGARGQARTPVTGRAPRLDKVSAV